MKRRKNLIKTHKVSVSISEDEVDFLEALAKGGGGVDGKSYTEAATVLLRERIKELMDLGVLQKRRQAIIDAKSFLGKNKKKI